MTDAIPRGFRSVTSRLGLKTDADDFALVVSDQPTVSAAMFTRSRFPGPSVVLSRQARDSGTAFRGVVVISKNANVATGADGIANAELIRRRAAEIAGCEPAELLIASTGVIGVPYPMTTIEAGLDALGDLAPVDSAAVAAAIMTTDTRPKFAARRVGEAVVVGVAKGVGMIEPNLATMLSFVFTDAQLSAEELNQIFAAVVDRTFNALSIDTDTSTSDTAAIIANGAAGPVDPVAFEAALDEILLQLVKAIASDGEGATTAIEVQVSGARDDAQAKVVAKSVVNSPLVKTAVHGADPNWGRVAMAIGKNVDYDDIDPDRVRIGFGETEVYPSNCLGGPEATSQLAEYLRGDEVVITVDLGIGSGRFTVYGCDLSEGYIRINADYTT